jgi:hypothetical protein
MRYIADMKGGRGFSLLVGNKELTSCGRCDDGSGACSTTEKGWDEGSLLVGGIRW